MSFGPIMHLQAGELSIELAPLNKEVMGEFIASGGMQEYSVTRFLNRRAAPVLEDEQEWYERVRQEKDSLVWGIWIRQSDGQRLLIGTTGLHQIGSTEFGDHFRIATSGSMIFRQEYWGRGIARHIHKARTWYAFRQLGLTRVLSAVIDGNYGSERALWHSGYDMVCVERNTHFVDGQFCHQKNLQCLNPDPEFWRQWWRKDRPEKRWREARKRTLDTLAWAEAEVKLL